MGEEDAYVVYRPIQALHLEWGRWQGTWSDMLEVLPVEVIVAIVGVWQPENNKTVHVLRKHPALSLLNQAERGAVRETETVLN